MKQTCHVYITGIPGFHPAQRWSGLATASFLAYTSYALLPERRSCRCLHAASALVRR